jgi:hypothetical protein
MDVIIVTLKKPFFDLDSICSNFSVISKVPVCKQNDKNLRFV